METKKCSICYCANPDKCKGPNECPVCNPTYEETCKMCVELEAMRGRLLPFFLEMEKVFTKATTLKDLGCQACSRLSYQISVLCAVMQNAAAEIDLKRSPLTQAADKDKSD